MRARYIKDNSVWLSRRNVLNLRYCNDFCFYLSFLVAVGGAAFFCKLSSTNGKRTFSCLLAIIKFLQKNNVEESKSSNCELYLVMSQKRLYNFEMYTETILTDIIISRTPYSFIINWLIMTSKFN